MAVHFEILHTTSYKYAKPVSFGVHQAMFLPRPAVCGRLLGWSARTSPPSKVRWVSDPLGNNITLMEFSEPSSELVFTFQFSGVHYGARAVAEFPLEPRAEEAPIQYTPEEWTDLAVFKRPHADDHDSSVAVWAKSFISDNRDRTTDILKRMVDAFQRRLQLYRERNTGHAGARRDLADEIGHLPRLCLADDRSVAPARLRFAFCQRLSL